MVIEMKKLFFLMLLAIIPFLFNNKEIDVVTENKEEVVVFYYNDSILKGIVLEVNNNKINDAFDYLSIKSNSAKSNYETKLNLSNTLNDFKIEDDSIFLYSDTQEDIDSLKQIYITYQFMGYKNVFYNDLLLDYLINPVKSGSNRQRIVSISNEDYIVNDYLTDNKSLDGILECISYLDYEIINYSDNEIIEIEVNKLNNEYYLIIDKTIKFNYDKSLKLIVKN